MTPLGETHATTGRTTAGVATDSTRAEPVKATETRADATSVGLVEFERVG